MNTPAWIHLSRGICTLVAIILIKINYYGVATELSLSSSYMIIFRGGRREMKVVGLKIRARKRAAKNFSRHAHFPSPTRTDFLHLLVSREEILAWILSYFVVRAFLPPDCRGNLCSAQFVERLTTTYHIRSGKVVGLCPSS